ncbi:MAG: LOG family protein [Elusimicrobia bacterium]|nr:LOG family protein [Elusimicrobiota bacterium]
MVPAIVTHNLLSDPGLTSLTPALLAAPAFSLLLPVPVAVPAAPAVLPAPAAQPTAMGSLQGLTAGIEASRQRGQDELGTLSAQAFDGAADPKPATFDEIPALDERYTTPDSRSRTVTVLGSSRAADPILRHMDLAARIAGELVRRGYNILSGCGNAGIMGAAYDAAAAASKEAARTGARAGENLAIVRIPAWGDENLADARAIGIADSEAARIEKFHKVSDTFLVFPGGASSIQEASFLIGQNERRGSEPPKRILFVGRDFYRGLEAQYDRLYAQGLLAAKPRELFQVVDSADEIIAAVTAPAQAVKPAKPSRDPAGGYTRQVGGAYLVYPGGPTALQEAATLIARNKYRGKNPPLRIYLIGRDFFRSLSEQYRRLYEDGLLGSKPEELFSVVDSADEVPSMPLP